MNRKVSMNEEPSINLPLKTRITLAVFELAMKASRRSNYTINRCLSEFLDPKAPAPKTIPTANGVLVSSTDISVDVNNKVWFRLFVPTINNTYSESSQKVPLIIYIHGGGFIYYNASSKLFDAYCRHLAGELSAVVASISYRLAPEHRYPSQYNDVYDVLKFIDSQYSTIFPTNTDITRCFVMGDSAGGNIAHHMTVRYSRNSEEFKELRINGLILLQPFFGGEERTESELRITNAPIVNLELSDWCWKAFLPEGSDRNHPAANVLSDDIEDDATWVEKFPATVVVIGGFDPLQDWQRRYYKGLKERFRGREEKVVLIEYPDVLHGFYASPALPQAASMIREIKNFILKNQESSLP